MALTNRQLVALDGELTPFEVGTYIASMWRAGEVERSGHYGGYAYKLTNKGRSRVA